MKYRKKPVEINAFQYWGDMPELARWMKEMNIYAPKITHSIDKGEVYIPTLEGTMTASKEDYIICGVKGEFYPCKPDIFEMTYDLIKENGNIPCHGYKPADEQKSDFEFSNKSQLSNNS